LANHNDVIISGADDMETLSKFRNILLTLRN
jgi:hypothetical protein